MRSQLLAIPLLLLAGGASAETVYAQPGTASCVPECSTSHSAGGFGIRTFDNFALGSAETISTVSWQGTYFGLLQGLDDPPPAPSTTSWQLDFYSSSGASPAASLFSVTLPNASVTSTLIGTGPNQVGAYNLDYYAFTATLPNGFDAVAGTQYWFSPWSIAPSFLVFFMWSPSTLAYDGASWQIAGAAAPQPLRTDFSFALGAAPGVPEPASWALLIVGFGAVGLASRRRRFRAEAPRFSGWLQDGVTRA